MVCNSNQHNRYNSGEVANYLLSPIKHGIITWTRLRLAMCYNKFLFYFQIDLVGWTKRGIRERGGKTGTMISG